jgi:hypothetical protein
MLGWMSPITIVWLWHALFDGTRLCRCSHSRHVKEASARWLRMTI